MLIGEVKAFSFTALLYCIGRVLASLVLRVCGGMIIPLMTLLLPQSLKDDFLLVHGFDRVPQMWRWPRCSFLAKRNSSEILSASIEALGDSLSVTTFIDALISPITSCLSPCAALKSQPSFSANTALKRLQHLLLSLVSIRLANALSGI